MKHYIYNGPVLNTNRVVSNNWKGETYAISDKKAINNLGFQYKKQYGLSTTAKIILPNKPVIEQCAINTNYNKKSSKLCKDSNDMLRDLL